MKLNEQINRIKEMMGINDRFSYRIATYDEFENIASNLNTLDFEDDQVRIPAYNEETDNLIFQFSGLYIYVRNREALPESGPYELFILDGDDDPMGFIRGTKKDNILSFNLVYITPEERGKGLGTEIYEYFLNHGFIIKSDKEISYGTYSIYTNLAKSTFNPIIFSDGRIGLIKK